MDSIYGISPLRRMKLDDSRLERVSYEARPRHDRDVIDSLPHWAIVRLSCIVETSLTHCLTGLLPHWAIVRLSCMGLAVAMLDTSELCTCAAESE